MIATKAHRSHASQRLENEQKTIEDHRFLKVSNPTKHQNRCHLVRILEAWAIRLGFERVVAMGSWASCTPSRDTEPDEAWFCERLVFFLYYLLVLFNGLWSLFLNFF